jgi:hypothetical protein
MNLIGIAVLAQLAAGRTTLPVLAFPEPGLDDTASYQGYQTRFFRDAARNTVQIYIDGKSGRVVHLWADAENSSAGFTVRTGAGQPAAMRWRSNGAAVSQDGRARALTYTIEADHPQIAIGWFLLGSMRVERDFQYWGRHREAFGGRFRLAEMDSLLRSIARLAPVDRREHLTFLNARDTVALARRLRPALTLQAAGNSWVATAVQPSLDARDTMTVAIAVDQRQVLATRLGDSLSLRSRRRGSVTFDVTITTTGDALTPLAREEIFNGEFLAFLGRTQRFAATAPLNDSSRIRARLLERQVRGVELLSSREKLMAGLPAYATYFGRDMLVSALMMRPIWRDEMSAFVVAAVLRRLSPSGQVSHEEALGGQATREAAAEYSDLIRRYLDAEQRGGNAASRIFLTRAATVLRNHRRTRENYHMIDDELQLPILAARWLGDPAVSQQRKRAFLGDSSDGNGPRHYRLLRELALVAQMTAPYAANPVATNLISFAPRDTGWSSASWRDSGAGYAGGRYAMDINAIWAPHALEAMMTIVKELRSLRLPLGDPRGPDSSFARYARDTVSLRRAIDTWWGASRHFVVRLGPDEVRSRVTARLAAMRPAERDYWTSVVRSTGADRDSLVFLALSLDRDGQPIGVANSDPATALFLHGHESRAEILRDVRVFLRPFPVGLFIDRVGTVVANDAYATPPVWSSFDRDSYHGPRVVWGREINLFLAGLAGHINTARDAAFVAQLRAALAQVNGAAEASGFQSELWSYEVRDGRVVPVRYGISSDVQLWSTTDLAVQFLLARLRR